MVISTVFELDEREFYGGLPLRAFNFRQADDFWHRHRFHELVLVRRGSGIHQTGEGEYAVARGDLFLVLPGTVHTYRNVNNMEIVNLIYLPEKLALPLFDLEATEEYRTFFLPRRDASGARFLHWNRRTLRDDRLREAENILCRMLREQAGDKPGWEFYMKLLFLELIRLICLAYHEEPDKAADECGRLAGVVDFIERNYAGKLSLARLASVAGRSPGTLIRTFRNAYGCTPIDYLISCRLRKGAELLLSTDLRVIDIALKTGFCDSNYFTKLFSCRYGCSPRAYREAGRREN